jgi:ferritin
MMPMLTGRMEKALNEQINAEMYSAYLYLSMSAHSASLNLPGFANWMKVQAQEEMVHAMKFYGFVLGRGGKVTLASIAGPPAKWAGPSAMFQAVLEHERKVTGLIHGLVDLAVEEKDHPSNIFLQWFVTEQVEEEASADAVVQQLKILGDEKNGLFILDRELGQRVFTPPAASAGAGA